MATYKLIATATPNAASNTSFTSAFQVPGEYTHFMIMVPSCTAYCATASVGIRVVGCDTATGTFREVGYSNNPATSTSGFRAWDCGADMATNGGIVICEALQFVPGYAKLSFTRTMTASTGFLVYGRKFD